jgi:hypothetical protein
MSNFGVNVYAAQRLAQHRIEEDIRRAERVRLAREASRSSRRTKPRSLKLPRPRLRAAWAFRRAAV